MSYPKRNPEFTFGHSNAEPVGTVTVKTKVGSDGHEATVEFEQDWPLAGAPIELLNTYLKGWIGYFRLIDTLSTLQALDEWIRRRLTMCLLKQWRKQRPDDVT